MARPQSIEDLPLTSSIAARLMTMGSCGEEAARRKRAGLPVEGMSVAEAIEFIEAGTFRGREIRNY